MNTFSSLSQKNITKLLLMVLIGMSLLGSTSPSLASVTGTDVGDIGMDANTTVGVTVSTGKQIFSSIADNVLEPLALEMMGKLMDKMNASIVNWVNTGFEGNPLYVDDPKQFFTNLSFDVASNVAGQLRTELNNLETCSPDNANGYSAEQCDNFQSKTANRSILYALGNRAFSGTTDALAMNPATLRAFGDSFVDSVNPIGDIVAMQSSLQGLQNGMANLSSNIAQLSTIGQNISNGNVSASDFNVVIDSQQNIVTTLGDFNSIVSTVQGAVDEFATIAPNAQGLQTINQRLQSFDNQITSARTSISAIDIPNPVALVNDLTTQAQNVRNTAMGIIDVSNDLQQLTQGLTAGGTLTAAQATTFTNLRNIGVGNLATMASTVGATRTIVDTLPNFLTNLPAISGLSTSLDSLQQLVQQASQDLSTVTLTAGSPAANTLADIQGTLGDIDEIAQAGISIFNVVSTLDLSSLSGSLVSDVEMIVGQLTQLTQSGNGIVAGIGNIGNGAAGNNRPSRIEEFQGDFTKGGTRAYEAMMLDENTMPIGRFMNTLTAINQGITSDTSANELEGKTQSDTSCQPGATREITDKEGKVLSSYCIQYQVDTPFGFVDAQLQESIGAGFSSLMTKSTNPFAQLATAALESLVTGVMGAGLNQVNSLVSNTVGDLLSGSNGTSTTGQSAFTEVTNVEGELDESLFTDINASTYAANTTFDIDAFIYGKYDIYEDQVFGKNLRRLDSGSIVFDDQPGRSLATAQPVTANSISVLGTVLSYEETNGLQIVEIVEDDNDLLPLGYYYINPEGVVFMGEQKVGENVFTPRFENSALDRFQAMNEHINEQRRTLSQLPQIAMNVDQHCVLGPDLGFQKRFNSHFQSESQKHIRKADKEDSNDKRIPWTEALDGAEYLRSWFLSNVSEKMTQDVSTQQALQLRDQIIGYNNLGNELDQRSSVLNSARAQVASLVDDYLNSETSEKDRIAIVSQLARLDQQRAIPSDNEVQREKAASERLIETKLEFESDYIECFDEIKAIASDPQVWPGDWHLQAKVVQDAGEKLYCPWIIYERDSLSGPEDMAFPGMYATIQAGHLSEDPNVDVTVGYNAHNYSDLLNKPVYSFIPEWIRFLDANNDEFPGADLDGNFLSVTTKGGRFNKSLEIDCRDFYRSSITDYLPFQFSTF